MSTYSKIADDTDGIALAEGFWEEFLGSDRRAAQVDANKVSYFWDELIESFAFHAMNGTQHFCSHPGPGGTEPILRFMAKENRTRRRALANAFFGLVAKAEPDHRATRIMEPDRPGAPFYVFLLVPVPTAATYDEYRTVRREVLAACCRVLRLINPLALDVVGIATENGRWNEERSEDAIHFDGRDWTDEDAKDARDLQENLDLFTRLERFEMHTSDFPRRESVRRSVPSNKVGRNSPCPCGSGKKYKRCCVDR